MAQQTRMGEVVAMVEEVLEREGWAWDVYWEVCVVLRASRGWGERWGSRGTGLG